ncbi:hypothetical protein ZIOFF_016287 [Zingiber officinale]|uniref:Trehalose 6-phosphate phosphatase n=1 Tax=Zingiber officinale TaxID=94328 RepID=A0A8J5LV40_ZINOF|nr:hypothetical protein ZIOFF_016287 [Zingiber officinale]
MFRQIKLGRGGRPSSWIQSIPASSPTQIKEGAAALTASHGGGGDYERWLELHPSALDNFEEVMSSSKGNQIVMFLDYDGTLSLIVDDPDCAFMSDEMREAVRDVASHFPTAIVSRRCREKARYCARTRILAVKFLPLPSTFGSGARSILDQVSSFVRLSELYHAGSHGMDIKGPIHGHRHTEAKAKSVLFQPASEFLPMIDEVSLFIPGSQSTRNWWRLQSVPGSRVENNKFCLSVHFRCVEEKVMEIGPTIKWDKGSVPTFLRRIVEFNQ